MWLRSQHVEEVGLLSVGDREIWEHAIARAAVVVTKDADFAHLSTLRSGPQVLRLRFGNTRNAELQARLRPLLSCIVAALDAGERLVEVV